MIPRTDPRPIASFLPVGPEALESYEEWQERVERRRESLRAFARSVLARVAGYASVRTRP